ncbi:glutathione S-transferase family protein [Amylibacter sp. SFDW26]|uniref:glutathione S-transferase family protein n=1 Tax=Amylibacter sp. SFDW26 TaxID=2652722 RepID=UPI00186A71BE|nr:glutathione S-transferase family protein [Amylibacter sp. SFDW26]
MYTLYWSEGTASFAPQAVLEEAGLPYKLVSIDIEASENRGADYLKVNPTGRVPTLITPKGEVIYESAAIGLYLIDHHGLDALAPLSNDPLRGAFLQSLIYLSNTVQAFYRTFYYPDRFGQSLETEAAFKATAVENLYDAWECVEVYLQKNGPYHLGDRFSFADIYLVMLITWFVPMDDILKRYPAIKMCFDLCAARPAIEKCMSGQTQISVGGAIKP